MVLLTNKILSLAIWSIYLYNWNTVYSIHLTILWWQHFIFLNFCNCYLKNSYIYLFPASPGKLKHNLNINVNALRPGIEQPKLGLFPKSRSQEFPNSLDTNTSKTDHSSNVVTTATNEKIEVLSNNLVKVYFLIYKRFYGTINLNISELFSTNFWNKQWP